MTIEINDKNVVIDGKTYVYKPDAEKEPCGRFEIAEMLGYRFSDGSVNMNNLYKSNPSAVYAFPNFEIEKAANGAKPWTRSEVKAWLSIPLWERKKMYKETLNELD